MGNGGGGGMNGGPESGTWNESTSADGAGYGQQLKVVENRMDE